MSGLSDFDICEEIGRGTYGTVYKVRRLLDDRMYVLKQIRITHMNKAEQQNVLNEVRLLARVESDYVVQYYDSFVDNSSLNIIMEYCPGGDLHNKIQQAKKNKTPFPEREIWRIVLELAFGLTALHNLGIIHRDIKPMNILIGDGGTVKIADLGVAKLLDSKQCTNKPSYCPIVPSVMSVNTSHCVLVLAFTPAHV